MGGRVYRSSGHVCVAGLKCQHGQQGITLCTCKGQTSVHMARCDNIVYIIYYMQARYMRQLVLAGLGDHVARKISKSVEEKKRLHYVYQVTK